jgi:hypothetical protein
MDILLLREFLGAWSAGLDEGRRGTGVEGPEDRIFANYIAMGRCGRAS